MHRNTEHSSAEEKPASGKTCIVIGAGFIAGLAVCLFAVLMLAGY